MKIKERTSVSRKNNSVLYLALLCLLYLLLTSNYLPFNSSSEADNTDDKIFIEISKEGIATVKSFENTQELLELKLKYDIEQDLISGDKVTIDDNQVVVNKISGRKRISLGVPIGINSATSEDLVAIPGLGPELAKRIIDYRERIGEFQSIDELDNIEGIGKKKLANIKRVGNLD